MKRKANMTRLTFFIFIFLAFSCWSTGENLLGNMEKEKVVPEVIDKVPNEVAEVSFPSGVKADVGNILTPTKVKDAPTVKWNADTNTLYTICMIDPDAPSRADPKNREYRHWLVVNIPGNDIKKGEVLTEYIGAGPPKGTGLHRYVIVVYKQPKKLTYDEQKIPKTRPKFSLKMFAKNYDLGEPIAANFFLAEWDEYVPLLYEQLCSK